MAQAGKGDTVQVRYTGRLEDGTVFDSSEGRDPLDFTLGEGTVIAGLDEAVRGMEVGDKKTTTIPASKAYGDRREELVISLAQDKLPEDLEPEAGQHLQMRTPDGQSVPVVVKSVAEETIEVDANHLLAGQDLTFDIELLGIN